MNITIYALATSTLSSSPFIQFSSYYKPTKIAHNNLKLNKFFNNYFFSYTKAVRATFSNSIFRQFMKTPIIFTESDGSQNNDLRYSLRDFQTTQQWDQSTEYSNIYIIQCHFIKCTSNGRGGAIKLAKKDTTITVHGCNFENCTAIDGGAIFACGEEKETNIKYCNNNNCVVDVMTHVPTKQFNSQYCCYWRCTAKRSPGSNEKDEGYGSAALIVATIINLNFSSTNECPAKECIEEKNIPYGAQFDLNISKSTSKEISKVDSCNINATTGYSVCCSAIE